MSVTIEQLQGFARAWNAHDIEALMSFMHTDCVFDTWLGSAEFGTRYLGVEQVRQGYMKACPVV